MAHLQHCHSYWVIPRSHLSTHDERDPNPEEEQLSSHVEDPAQRAEKRRLIAVFEGGSTADGAIPAVLTITVIAVTVVTYTTVM